MSSDDVVIINDDNQKDSDIEVIDVSKDTRAENNAIIIDDDIIEVIDVDATRNSNDIKDYLNKVCSENKLIAEFIEKCLDLEYSDGMLRVIYRTFLPLYFKMEDGYRESNDFKKVVDMATRALEVTPNLKFTHLKFVCDIMKSKSRDRKKVQITTLSSNVTAKPTNPRKQRKRRKRRGKLSSVKKSKKRKSEYVIELDESSDAENRDDMPALDPATDDVVILDDNKISDNSNKENRILEQSSAPPVQDSNIVIDRSNNLNMEGLSHTPVLEASQPQMQPESYLDEKGSEPEKKERIKQIEKQIQYYKNVVDTLEQEEVETDTMSSPYLRCERVKAHIVSLYKELCSLTGDEPVKKREIHFTATDGRPQLPLKILESFINENIGSDGIPCLPDFFDVVQCVYQANESAGLGWDKARIWREARALFTYCGQALQDSRKKREWRYMLGLANSQLDDDPAERDPELMARLEANRRVAVKKELDLLEQYVKLEEGRCYGESIPNDFHVSQDPSDDEFEENTFTASTSNPNYRNHLKATIVTNNVHRCRTEGGSINSEMNMGYNYKNVISFEQRFENNQVQEMVAKQPHNSDTRMLEISIGDNRIPEIRSVTVNNANYIENQRSVAYLKDNNEVTRMIEGYVQNNKPPELNVINVARSDHDKGNSEQDSVTSTCQIDFDNSIREKVLETFEDTYKDFVNSRAPTSINRSITKSIPLMIKDVYSVKSNPQSSCNSMNSSENMPLVIKEVYSVATKQIGKPQNTLGNNNRDKDNLVELGNKSLFNPLSVSTKQNDHSPQSKTSDSSVAFNNMSIMIKDAYSVATEQYSTSIQVNCSGLDNNDVTEKGKPSGKSQEIISGEADTTLKNVTVVSQNDNATTANTNLEPQSNVEEQNSIKVKTEVSDLLIEMEHFGDSFTATVFDIEDPFLVIEISDSSDESDDDLASRPIC